MHLTAVIARPLVAALVMALVMTGVAPAAPSRTPGPVKVRTSETTHAVDGSFDFSLAMGTTHIVIHWSGHPEAHVDAAFSADGAVFSEPAHVHIDEFGASTADGETYGSVMVAGGMRAVRVTADQSLPDVSVLAMNAAGETDAPPGLGAGAAALSTIPGVIPRSGWGADESIRFDSLGEERWTRAFYPLQKLVVHHTAGTNGDPNPAATVRAIYHYHAVTLGWGDIGYEYLIDAQGRVYEGRYSREYWNGVIPTADNEDGDVVEAGHALHHNPGSMGIALLGNFTSTLPSAAARASLVRMLAWASAAHGINPLGSSTYVNPATGASITTMNITGHRDYQNTGCPGAPLYNLMPSIRASVAAEIANPPTEVYNPHRALSFAAGTYVGRQFNASGTITASKSFTLSAASSAPTNQKSTIPNQSGNWYYITAGVWAGYWIVESASTTLGPAPAPQVAESYQPWRPLNFAAGTHVGRRFNTYGSVYASKSYTLVADSWAPTTEKSTIPNQSGNWYFITAGVWDGYWIQESAGTTLGAVPPPPPPPVVENYDPPRSLYFAAGTHVGRQFSATGAITASKSYTLATVSNAPTSMKSTIPNQPGNWFYITAGVWAGYWIPESPVVTLGEPPPPPPPPVVENYDPPRQLYFAAGTYVGRQFSSTGAITASKSYTLATSSNAPTNQKSTIPNQSGNWYFITAGVWAGYWIQESAGTTLGP
ncbi:MAG: N-acetylmuramoyl-L-alanine amidase [Candidatus Limnocylindria bacterium]